MTFGNALIQTMSYELLKEDKWNGSQFAEKSIDQFNEKTFLPIAVPTIAVAMALAKKILTDSRTSFSRRIKLMLNLLSRIAKRRIPIFRRHPVYLVCFVGQDGTGKTEHARYTLKQLRQMSKKIKTKYIWSRGFGYSFQPFLLVMRWLLVGRKTPKSSIGRSIESRYIARKARLLKEEPMKTIWAYVMITDHLLSLVRAKVALYLGYVVICDRWIIDTLIDVRCDLGKRLNRFLEERIESLAPKPGMTFIMDVETDELLKRRPEMDQNLLECKRSSYLKYQDRKNFYRINTNDDFETNRKKILTAIMKGFFSQFE
jgi:thymidylate kinase